MNILDNVKYEDKESENEIEIPSSIRNLTTQAYDKSVSDVVRMITEKDIILDPEYQRNYVWDNKKASKLIESIILNVPIPVIYVSEELDSSWSVIDGLQRLYSLKRFFEGKFKLTGLEVLHELNKCDIKSLPSKSLRMLKNGLLRIVMITSDSNDDIRYDIFMRLNTGSVHLNEQELRNCLYRGKLNNFLQTMASRQEWLKLLGLNYPHKRMADRELLLRFLALSTHWDGGSKMVSDYRGNMKSFLNAFMKENQNNGRNLSHYETLCVETIEKIYEVYGENAFRRVNDDGSLTPINRAIMDALMISVIPFSKEYLLQRKEILRDSFANELSNNRVFRQSTLSATSDSKVLNYRISFWCSRTDDIMSR